MSVTITPVIGAVPVFVTMSWYRTSLPGPGFAGASVAEAVNASVAGLAVKLVKFDACPLVVHAVWATT